MRAYRRNSDGTIEIVDAIDHDGTPGDSYPWERTEDLVELLGWPDSNCRVWLTGGGVEMLIPEEVVS